MAVRVAEWFYTHLAGQKPILLLTEDKALLEQREKALVQQGDHKLSQEVIVMSLKDFLSAYHDDTGDLVDMYRSVSAREDELDGGGGGGGRDKDFVEHLKPEILEAGIKAGEIHYLRCNFPMNLPVRPLEKVSWLFGRSVCYFRKRGGIYTSMLLMEHYFKYYC